MHGDYILASTRENCDKKAAIEHELLDPLLLLQTWDGEHPDGK